AAAAIALQRIGGISDELQLLQHELRDHERAVDKAGLAHVGDAAVDDDARVENLVTPFRTGGAEQADEPRRLQPLAVLGGEDEAQIRQHQQDEAVEEFDAAVAAVGPEEPGADGARDPQADGAADERAQDASDGGVAQATFEQNDQRRENQTEPDVGQRSDRQRMEGGGGIGDRGDE